MAEPKVIVVGNEKGGAGKSTLAIHLATALMHSGARLSVLDLDLRQQSMAHFFSHRRAWLAAAGQEAPMPKEHPLEAALAKAPDDQAIARFDEAFAAAEASDFILIDTPGADTAMSRAAHGRVQVCAYPLAFACALLVERETWHDSHAAAPRRASIVNRLARDADDG